MTPAPQKAPLMTIDEVAAQLGIHPKTMVIYARRGDIASYRIGLGRTSPYKFSQEQVDAFLKTQLHPVRAAS